MVDVTRFHTERCVGCKACTKACPSSRNGGIVPDAVIRHVNEGKEPIGLWKCLQCHRCSDACPQKISVSEVILEFRSFSEKPDRFNKNIETIAKYGRSVAPSGMVAKQREQLGLNQDKPSPEIIDRIGKIMETGQ